MKVLIISENLNYLNEENPDLFSLIDFSEYLEQLHVIVLNKRNIIKKKKILSSKDKLYVYPVDFFNFLTKEKAFYDTFNKNLVWKQEAIVDLIIADDPGDASYFAFNLSQKLKIPYIVNVKKSLKRDSEHKDNYEKIFNGAGGIEFNDTEIKQDILKINNNLEHKLFSLEDYINFKNIDNNEVSANLYKKYPNAGFFILLEMESEDVNFYKEIFKAVKNLNSSNIKSSIILMGKNKNYKKIINLAKHIIPKSFNWEKYNHHFYDYLKKTNLFILNGESGEFNKKILTSVVSGCPVLTERKGMSGDYLDENYTGYFFKKNKKNIKETVFNSVMDVLRDPNIRDKIQIIYKKRLLDKITTNKDEYYQEYIKKLMKYSNFVDTDKTFFKY